MTKLFERAVESVRRLAPETQDEIGRLVLRIAGDEESPPVQLTEDEIASFEESSAQAAKGQFATDEEVRGIWAKHGL